MAKYTTVTILCEHETGHIQWRADKCESIGEAMAFYHQMFHDPEFANKNDTIGNDMNDMTIVLRLIQWAERGMKDWINNHKSE